MIYTFTEIRTSNDINFVKSIARHEFYAYRVLVLDNPNLNEEILLMYRASNFAAHSTYTSLPLR